MSDAWFSPGVASLFSFLSLLSLCAVFEAFAKQGRHLALVIAVWNGVLGFAALLLFGSGLALVTGQPSYVARSLALSGFVLGAVFTGTWSNVKSLYRKAELRKTVATDL